MGIEWILGIIVTALGGLNIYQLIFWRTERDKLQAQAAKESVEAKKAEYELSRDQFVETKKQLDDLQDEFMELQKKIRNEADEHTRIILSKCNEIAELKSKLLYFKNIRCYMTECPNRIKTNPKDNHREEKSNEQELQS